MAPSYKLSYFNGRGRAEIIRWIFAAANVEYEDHRWEFKDWPQWKPKMPLGFAPVLFIDERPLSQSGCITRYVANAFGMMGDSHISAAVCDMIFETVKEMSNKLPRSEKDPEAKAAGMKKCYEESVMPALVKLEARYQAQKKSDKHLVGTKLTLADIAVAYYMSSMNKDECGPEYLKQVPGLVGVMNATLELPEIKKWIATRPDTQF